MTGYANSVQSISITIPNGSTSATASLASPTGTYFIIGFGETSSNAGTSAAVNLARLELTNPTTLTAFRNTSSTDTITVKAYVIDATSSLVASVQNGTVSLTSAQSTNTATVTSVNTSNSAIQYLGCITTNTGNGINIAWGRFTQTSATVVTLNVNTSGATTVAGFCLIEFQSAVMNQAVQGFTDTASPSVTTRTHTVTSVNTNNALLIYAGCTSSGTSIATGSQYVTLTNGTTVTIGTVSAPFVSLSLAAFLVEFIAGVLSSNAQRGTIALSAAASNTATITSVNTSLAGANFGHNSASGANFNVNRFSDVLTNATTVTLNSNTAATGTGAWEVHEWTAGTTVINADDWSSSFEMPVRRARGSAPSEAAIVPYSQSTNWIERTTPDKYRPEFPDFPRRTARPVVPFGFHVEPRLIAWPERTTPDKYKPDFPDFPGQRAKSGAQNGQPYQPQLIAWPERTTPDKWKPEIQTPVRRPWKPMTEGGTAAFQTEVVTVDKYHPLPQVPVRRYNPAQWGMAFNPQLTDWVERSSPDKWKPDFPDFPGRKALNGSQWGRVFDPILTAWGERITPDKWKPDFPDFPGRRAPTGAQWGVVFFPQQTSWAETIFADKWRPDYPDFPGLRAKSGARWGEAFIPILTSWNERITPDKYHPEFPDFPGRKALTGARWGLAFIPQLINWNESITPDKWLPSIMIPKRRPIMPNMDIMPFLFYPPVPPIQSITFYPIPLSQSNNVTPQQEMAPSSGPLSGTAGGAQRTFSPSTKISFP